MSWWHEAVLYQVYVRSFADSDGDGIGDLDGLISGLPALVELGVDALWLSPCYPSPRADGGYDVADYCDIAAEYGGLPAFRRVLRAAHEAGLRVILDWVPNHTSDEHPWFLDASSSRGSERRSWYVWRDGRGPGVPPNNWTASWGGSAWTWHEETEQWFLTSFTSRQPELDWSNPDVVAAMHDVLRFWLALGVDGFRVDVIHMLAKPEGLPDVSREWADEPIAMKNHDDAVREIVRGLRAVLGAASPDVLLLGEVSVMDTSVVASYLDQATGLHLAFDFVPMLAPWDTESWRRCLDDVCREVEASGGWPTWTFANHDNSRPPTRYGSLARARAVAVALLTLRGTPVLYAGEELGLEDAEVPADRVEDVGGRDGCRAVLPWTSQPGHGWGERPWMVHPPEAATLAREVQRGDPRSTLRLYRDLLAMRRTYPTLRCGAQEHLVTIGDGLAWLRSSDDGAQDDWVVGIGFGQGCQVLLPPGEWEVVLDSRTGTCAPMAWDGRAPSDTALVARRRQRPVVLSASDPRTGGR